MYQCKSSVINTDMFFQGSADEAVVSAVFSFVFIDVSFSEPYSFQNNQFGMHFKSQWNQRDLLLWSCYIPQVDFCMILNAYHKIWSNLSLYFLQRSEPQWMYVKHTLKKYNFTIRRGVKDLQKYTVKSRCIHLSEWWYHRFRLNWGLKRINFTDHWT